MDDRYNKSHCADLTAKKAIDNADKFMFADKKKPLFIEVKDEDLTIRYGQEENIDIYAKLTPEVMDGVIAGRMTFQRAFMTGEMTAKGNFKILRMLDTVFNFA